MSAGATPNIDATLARRLVDTRFPRWAGLPLRPHDPAGSDHVIYRLGDELSVRLPRHDGAIGQARKEAEWLPRLAVPVPVEVGEPGFGYPWPWAVSRWLDGEVATVEALSGSHEAAEALAGFLLALHRFDAEPTGIAAPLSTRDAALAAPQQDPVWRHGDFHTGNLLTIEGRLSAVIDFGEFGVGDPALDLIIASRSCPPGREPRSAPRSG